MLSEQCKLEILEKLNKMSNTELEQLLILVGSYKRYGYSRMLKAKELRKICKRGAIQLAMKQHK